MGLGSHVRFRLRLQATISRERTLTIRSKEAITQSHQKDNLVVIKNATNAPGYKYISLLRHALIDMTGIRTISVIRDCRVDI